MATPHVAGAAALIRQWHPDWDPFVVRAALMNNARFMVGQGDVMAQGAGRLDLERAITTPAILVTVGEPLAASHSFGTVEHKGQKVRVSQRFQVIDLSGQGLEGVSIRVRWLRRAPGLRTYRSARSLSVASNCRSAFDLVVDVNGPQVPDGPYCGLLEAGLGDRVLRVPFALVAKGSGPSVPRPPGPQIPLPSGRSYS